MNKLFLPILIVIFLTGLFAGLTFWKPKHNNINSVTAESMGGDFTLLSSQGPVSLNGFRGKVVLLYFGYTWCPDICPTALSRIGAALKRVEPEELERLQGLFISVDPDRDTPEKLAEYSKFFHPDIVGLTGSPEGVAEIAKRYGVSYRLNNTEGEENYSVDHSSLIILIDKNGKFREILPHEASVTSILKVSRSLLSEK